MMHGDKGVSRSARIFLSRARGIGSLSERASDILFAWSLIPLTSRSPGARKGQLREILGNALTRGGSLGERGTFRYERFSFNGERVLSLDLRSVFRSHSSYASFRVDNGAVAFCKRE